MISFPGAKPIKFPIIGAHRLKRVAAKFAVYPVLKYGGSCEINMLEDWGN